MTSEPYCLRQVKSARGTVRFTHLLVTRLLLGVGPACLGPPRRGGSPRQPGQPRATRPPLSRQDLLSHLATVSDRQERVRQFRQLVGAWREAERRQLACLRLLAAVVRLGLVPARAARRCLERLLGGDGVSRQPPDGPVDLSERQLHTEWAAPTRAERRALRCLVRWCNGESRPQ